MNSIQWDDVKPDVGFYGNKLWEAPTTLSQEKGWVFVDLPVRYALGWLDLLNAQDKEKTMPDRETLMIALDQVLTSYPERDPEGHDLPLNMVWDAVTYIQDLQDTIDRYDGLNQSLRTRIAKAVREREEAQEKNNTLKQENDMLKNTVTTLRDEVKLYRAQLEVMHELEDDGK